MQTKSRNTLIESNLRLVHSCANRFRSKGIEYEDLFQAGCMGLVKAVDGFDDTRGVKFSTYAVPVILGEIKRLFRDGGTVKVSRSIKELSMRLVRVKESLWASLGREPTISEVSAKAQIDEEQVVEAFSAMQPTISLTAHDDDGEETQFDIKSPGVEEEIGERLLLREVMESLDDKDRQMIILRYFGGKTQSQTAEHLGMTQVQVSRREKKVLSSLRSKLLL